MGARYNLLAGIAVLGLSIGCSTLNEDAPMAADEKCEVCHQLPPNDSAQQYDTTIADSTVRKAVHYRHVRSQKMTCDRCHSPYNPVTKTWNMPADHQHDTVACAGCDTMKCNLCHRYSNCNNSQCHQSPPAAPLLRKNFHTTHVKGTSRLKGTGYKCGVCHKGYDLEKKIFPVAQHDNGVIDVNFNLTLGDTVTLPNDPLFPPSYSNTLNTCNYVYCHGTTIPGGRKVIRLDEKMDTTRSGKCNFCHDTTALATAVEVHTKQDHISAFKDCLNCHDNYALKNGGVANNALHINGRVDLICTNCHLDSIPYPFVNINGRIQRQQ